MKTIKERDTTTLYQNNLFPLESKDTVKFKNTSYSTYLQTEHLPQPPAITVKCARALLKSFTFLFLLD